MRGSSAFRSAVCLAALVIVPAAATGQQTGEASCPLSATAVNALKKGMTEKEWTQALGCGGRKISSYDMLGITSEMFVINDGSRRVQLSVRNGKLTNVSSFGFNEDLTGAPR